MHVAVIFCSVAAPNVVRAQNTAPSDSYTPGTQVSAAERFTADMKSVSERFKICLLAEGQPIMAASEEALSLPADLTREEAVQRLSACYDYTAERRGSVFVLRKRYTDVADLPDVTWDECRLAMKAISQMLDPFNPHITLAAQFDDPIASGILRVLSEPQLQQMAQNGLPVSSLSAQQREEVWRLALHFYIQSQAEIMLAAEESVEAITRQNARFHRQEIAVKGQKINLFGLDVTYEGKSSPSFLSLSDSHKIVTRRGPTITFGDVSVNGEPVEMTDPTAPKKEDAPRKPAPVVSVSLSHLVANLNARPGATVVCNVDAVLGTKTVCVAGEKVATPPEMLAALAALYDLRVIDKKNGTLLLTRLKDPYARDVTEIGKGTRMVIPVPIKRALEARIQQPRLEARIKYPIGVTPPPALPVSNTEYHSAASAIREESIRQFRTLVEPKVQASQNKSLRLSQLSERERKLFVIAETIGAFAEASWLGSRTLPPYVADFDHVMLTGGLYKNEEGQPRFSLFMSYRDPKTGETYQGVGFTNTRLPQ